MRFINLGGLASHAPSVSSGRLQLSYHVVVSLFQSRQVLEGERSNLILNGDCPLLIVEAEIVLVEETEEAKVLTPGVAADWPTEMAPIIVMEQLCGRASKIEVLCRFRVSSLAVTLSQSTPANGGALELGRLRSH